MRAESNIYEGSTVTLDFTLWDNEEPTHPPITDLAEMVVTVNHPTEPEQTMTLTGSQVDALPDQGGVPGGDGRYRTRFEAASPGRYVANCLATTQLGRNIRGVVFVQVDEVPVP